MNDIKDALSAWRRRRVVRRNFQEALGCCQQLASDLIAFAELATKLVATVAPSANINLSSLQLAAEASRNLADGLCVSLAECSFKPLLTPEHLHDISFVLGMLDSLVAQRDLAPTTEISMAKPIFAKDAAMLRYILVAMQESNV